MFSAAEIIDFAVQIVKGCIEHQDAIDGAIRETAENWRLERMAIIDRNILRIGACELMFMDEIPPKVSINEAIELAKQYSTANSPTFVNGVLDKIYSRSGKRKDNATGQSPEEAAQGAVRQGYPLEALRPDPELRADLHVHSTASDGSVVPQALAQLAARAGLSAFALTDHDSVEGLPAAETAAQGRGVVLVPGVELTAYADIGGTGEETELHLLGLFIDPEHTGLRRKLEEFREVRVLRIEQMSRKLRELGFDIQSEEVLKRSLGGAVGRTHIAREMVEQGICRHVGEAFGRFLSPGGPAYVPKQRMTPAQAIELIKSTGGCAVLAHPGLLDGSEDVIRSLVSEGLDGVEVHYPMHTMRQERDFLELARQLDLGVAGGSDFHGDVKPNVEIGREFVSFVELERLGRKALAVR